MATILDDITRKEIAEKYPWFEAAHIAVEDGAPRYEIDYAKIREVSEGELIERFLRKGDYRIVAEEGEVTEEIRTEAEIDDDEEFVSEELAEIYLSQGLKNEAIEIYRKLSLLNTEKFAYFASKIDAIEGK